MSDDAGRLHLHPFLHPFLHSLLLERSAHYLHVGFLVEHLFIYSHYLPSPGPDERPYGPAAFPALFEDPQHQGLLVFIPFSRYHAVDDVAGIDVAAYKPVLLDRDAIHVRAVSDRPLYMGEQGEAFLCAVQVHHVRLPARDVVLVKVVQAQFFLAQVALECLRQVEEGPQLERLQAVALGFHQAYELVADRESEVVGELLRDDAPHGADPDVL